MFRFLVSALCVLQLGSGFVPGLLLTRCCNISKFSEDESHGSAMQTSIARTPTEVPKPCCMQHELNCQEGVQLAGVRENSVSASRTLRLHCCLDPYGLINKDRPCPMIDAADPDRAITAQTFNFRVVDFTVIVMWIAISDDLLQLGSKDCHRRINPLDSPHAMPPDRQILHCTWQC